MKGLGRDSDYQDWVTCTTPDLFCGLRGETRGRKAVSVLMTWLQRARQGKLDTWRRCSCMICLQFNASTLGVTIERIFTNVYTLITYLTMCLLRYNISTTPGSSPTPLPSQSPPPTQSNHDCDILHHRLSLYMDVLTRVCVYFLSHGHVIS